MNTKLVNSAAGVINAALTQNRTAAGIALALDSVQMLLTPEITAELEQLRARVAELEAQQEADHKTWQHDLRTAQSEREAIAVRVTGLETQRAALAVRLRAGQRWQRDRNPALVSQDYVGQDELRTIFGIQLTAPWDAPAEDPCHPCGCPKRFTQHSDGCPTFAPREEDDAARCLKVHAFSARDGWRPICSSCDHGRNASCHSAAPDADE